MTSPTVMGGGDAGSVRGTAVVNGPPDYERVWGITGGSEDERIDAAIEKTRAFFESLGVKTRLSDYGISKDKIDLLVDPLKVHGMTQLGERQDVTLEVSRQVYDASL